MGEPTTLSKSRFLTGLQCPKLLWTHYNAKDRIPQPDPGRQFIFDMGRLVGDLAKQWYPDGIEIDCPGPGGRPDVPATVAETARLLPLRKPLFEASFLADGRYVRADVLVPRDGGRWDLVEVKSSTKVKDVNLWDVAFQSDCLTRAGLEPERLLLMHIDTSYVRRGALDPRALFHQVDVTAEAQARALEVPRLFTEFAAVIDGDEPQTPIGSQCDSPFPCPLKPHCWAGLPEHHVTRLYYGGKKAFRWLAKGWETIDQLPPDRLSAPQRIQQNTVYSGQPHFETARVRSWLNGLEYPVHHLDFETMAPAVPLCEGTRPYQQVPFQFSLHVQDRPGAEPRHLEFLAEGPGDPRPGLLEGLRVIGPQGTVLAFNASFERAVLENLGADLPAFGHLTRDLIRRMDDLATPFQRFHAYHPRQQGKYSLKAVLPAWTDLSYEGLDIADGQAAAREFVQAMYGEEIGLTRPDGRDRTRVLADLKAYCRLDTLAMVELLKALAARV